MTSFKTQHSQMFSSSTTLNCKALSHNLITWNGTNNRQLDPVVQRADNTIHQSVQKIYCPISQIQIYPTDNIIHLTNNWGLMYSLASLLKGCYISNLAPV